MKFKLLLVALFLLLALPSVSAFCLFGFGDCGQQIFIINRGSNEDVNYTWLDTMEFAFERPAKNVDVEIIGAELVISSSSSISSGSPINISTGISKVQLIVLGGADTTGDIIINAVKHDRDTGATTEPYSETLALSGVGDMNMTTEWIGNKTSTNDINLTTTNFDGALKLTQWSFYQDAEEDFNVIRVSVTIETADTAAAKSFDFNFFKVAGDGNVTSLVEFNDIDFAPNGIERNKIYRLDRNCLVDTCFIDVSTDGIHAAFDQQNIETVEVVITYEFTRQLQVSGVAGNNVTRLLAGTNITLFPASGIGEVTISSSGGGTDYTDANVFSVLEAQVPWDFDANVTNKLFSLLTLDDNSSFDSRYGQLDQINYWTAFNDFNAFGTGNVLANEFDAQFGSDENGAIKIGNLQIAKLGGIGTVGDMNVDAINIFRRMDDGDNNILFLFANETEINFAIAKPLAELGAYFPRSLMVGGDLGNAYDDGIINCTSQGYTFIDCATDITGADLGVQDDVEIHGSLNLNRNGDVNAFDGNFTRNLRVNEILTVDGSSTLDDIVIGSSQMGLITDLDLVQFLNGELDVMGDLLVTQTIFADELGVNSWLLQTGVEITGVLESTIDFNGTTATNPTDIRFDLDGTHPVISSPQDAIIEIAETLFVQPSTDNVSLIGRASIGGIATDDAFMAHEDFASAITEIGFRQNENGVTFVNAPTGQEVRLRVNNSTTDVVWDGTTFTVDGTIDSGAITSTGAITSKQSSLGNLILIRDDATINTGNDLAHIDFGGDIGGGDYVSAQIVAEAGEVWDATSKSSRLLFFTTPDGTENRTLALTLNELQNAIFAGAVNLTDSKTLTIGAGNSADNDVLLKFDIDRTWVFEVEGEGSGTGLRLRNPSNKNFFIDTNGFTKWRSAFASIVGVEIDHEQGDIDLIGDLTAAGDIFANGGLIKSFAGNANAVVDIDGDTSTFSRLQYRDEGTGIWRIRTNNTTRTLEVFDDVSNTVILNFPSNTATAVFDATLEVNGDLGTTSCPYAKTAVYGAERANVSTNQPLAFGNGDQTQGVPQACDGVITAMTASCENCSSGVNEIAVEMRVNGVSQTCDTGQLTSPYDAETVDCDVAFSALDRINCYTKSETGTVTGVLCSFYIQYD